MDISGLIKVLRTAAGLTQRELAARAGISQNYLSMIENGHRSPTTATLERISEALNVPLPFLVMYRSGITESVGPRERQLLEKLRELCVDFLKLKLGLESEGDAEIARPEHQED